MPDLTTTVAILAAWAIVDALALVALHRWPRGGKAIRDEQRPAPVVVTPPAPLLYVADFGWMKPLPDDLYPVPALVQVGNAMVHPGCRGDRRDGRKVRNCCAPLLNKVTREVAR